MAAVAPPSSSNGSMGQYYASKVGELSEASVVLSNENELQKEKQFAVENSQVAAPFYV